MKPEGVDATPAPAAWVLSAARVRAQRSPRMTALELEIAMDRLQCSQMQLAAALSISARAVRYWREGRDVPPMAATLIRLLLVSPRARRLTGLDIQRSVYLPPLEDEILEEQD